jgi:hypothetical protein
MNLYVGNLPYRISEDQLKSTFEEFGEVSSCTIIKDKVTGQSKGFGFLEMPERTEAETAISNLNGRDLRRARARTAGRAVAAAAAVPVAAAMAAATVVVATAATAATAGSLTCREAPIRAGLAARLARCSRRAAE